jgi:hypothetical protein
MTESTKDMFLRVAGRLKLSIVTAWGIAYARVGDDAWRFSTPTDVLFSREHQQGFLFVVPVAVEGNDPNARAFPMSDDNMSTLVWNETDRGWEYAEAPMPPPPFDVLDLSDDAAQSAALSRGCSDG